MENREIFLKKLDIYEDCVGAISKQAQGIIDPDTRGKLSELQRNIKELHGRISGNLYEIAIIGLEKAGKSTFANALIGFDILPTKEERCTYTASCVKYAESTYAEVEFFTQEEFDVRFVKNLESLGISGEYAYSNFSIQQLERLIGDKTLSPDQTNVREDIEDMLKSRSEISCWLNSGTKKFSEADMKGEEFKNLIQNPDRKDGEYVQKPTLAVKKITVYSHNLGEMRNCEIYDVPGFDSPTAIHMEQTKERMNLADVVILIANASKPSITGPQLKIFRTAVDLDGVPCLTVLCHALLVPRYARHVTLYKSVTAFEATQSTRRKASCV